MKDFRHQSLPTSVASDSRIGSIDLLRGLVMIAMALDHAREFIHVGALDGKDPLDLASTSLPLFMTRWITHFCAPTFVLLAGISARIAANNRTPAQMTGYLFTRGVWLMVLELTLILLLWTGDVTFNYSFFSLQVIWVIGFCMAAMSLLSRLPHATLLALAMILIFGHNALDSFDNVGDKLPGILWSVMHVNHTFKLNEFHTMEVLYPALPWLGVMLLGYSLGELFISREAGDIAIRRRRLVRIGVSCTVFFLILRYLNIYGDPKPWLPQSSHLLTTLSFVDTTKYPPSLLFLLMTLGPSLIALALVGKWRGRLADVVRLFGTVPLFFYIIHLAFAHCMAWAMFCVQGRSMYGVNILASDGFRGEVGLPLASVYLAWLLLLILCYPFCKWYSEYKKTHRVWWTSYI